MLAYLINNASVYKFESCSWRGVVDTTICDKVCQLLTTYKTDRHDIFESGVIHHKPNLQQTIV